MLRFSRPVPPLVHAVVSSGWSRPRGDQPHRALDIPVKEGTPILAMAEGEVIRLWPSLDGDAGIWVGLRHAGNVVTRYMHLSRLAVSRLGERVAKGQVIGYSGNTGLSSTPHLHTDISVPASMLPEIEQEIGRPTIGWGALQEPYGYKIPAEPYIPVDGYSPRTIADAMAAHVRLYRPPHNNYMLVGAVVAALAMAYYLSA